MNTLLRENELLLQKLRKYKESHRKKQQQIESLQLEYRSLQQTQTQSQQQVRQYEEGRREAQTNLEATRQVSVRKSVV